MKTFNRTAITAVLLLFVLAGSSFGLYKAIFERTEKQPPRILVVLKTIDQTMEFWQITKAGIDVAAREFDVAVEVVGAPAESDISGQIQVVEERLKSREHLDAVVMAAADYNALVPVADRIKAKGIPLITIDSALNSNAPQSFIATDNTAAGRKAGEMLGELLPGGTRVAIIGHVKGTSTAIEREQGVKQGLGEAFKERLIGTYFCDGIQEKAYEIAGELLRKNPDIGGIAGLNEPSTLGAAKAIKELGLSGKIKLVGFDNSIPEVKLIEEGVIQGTVVQKPFSIGYLGIKTAVQLLKGKPVEKRIDTGSQIITKQNMYTIENQKLLFPFVDR